MDIVQVVPFIGEEASGPAYSVPELCFALVRSGCSVKLVTLRGVKNLHFGNLQHFSCKRNAVIPRLGISPEMKRALFNFGETASLYHSHSLWMMPNVYPSLAAKKFRKPLIVSPRGTLSSWAFNSGSGMKRLFWPLVQKPALSQTVCFHATAMSEYEDIRRHGFKQPVAVIPNGVHMPSTFEKATLSARTLLFLGRIHPIKGLDILLSAWRVVQDRFSDWQLRIVGKDGNQGYLDEMKRLAEELHLKRIDFAGPLYGDDKWQAYCDAEVFILPTYSENFGMSVAEALAAGTPAIVTTGAPWSGLQENGCGWWTEPNVDSLVAALEQSLSLPPKELAEMGARGRDWVNSDFSWDTIGQQMATTYGWILHGGSKPAWVLE